MAQSWRYDLQLERVQELQNGLRTCIERCEPCAFRIRDVHNTIIDNIKPLIDAQQTLTTSAAKSTHALREIRSLALECSTHTTRLQSEISSTRGMQDMASDLTSALDNLRALSVDPAFIGGESGHTLYDFVDESSVHSLQKQLQGELSEMEAIYNSCSTTIAFFDDNIKYMNQFLNAVLPVVYPTGTEEASAVDSVGVLMNALKAQCSLPAVDAVDAVPLHVLMQSWKTYAMELEVSVVSLASSVSQVENIHTRLLALKDRLQDRMADSTNTATSEPSSATLGAGARRPRTQSDSVVDDFARLQLGRGSPIGRTASTDSVADKAEEEYKHLFAELESCERTALERIRVGDVLADAWEGRMQELDVIKWCSRATKNIQQSAMQRIRGASLDMDRIVQATRERRAPFDEGIRRFYVLKQSVDALRQELTSLSFFYHEFATAYNALREEMIRRHRALTAMRAVVEEAERSLAQYVDQETEQRRAFLDEFGQFLPVSLCPEVQDAVPTFSITPTLAELLGSIPLPVLGTDPPSHEVPSRSDELDIIIPTIQPGLNESSFSTKPPTAQLPPGESGYAASSDSALVHGDIVYQPKPRRVVQSSLYGSDMPATTVFSPSPPSGIASPVECPPFAISPAANPLPDLSQFLESFGGGKASSAASDIFQFSTGAELPVPKASSVILEETTQVPPKAIPTALPSPLVLPAVAKPAPRQETKEQTEDAEANDWVHF